MAFVYFTIFEFICTSLKLIRVQNIIYTLFNILGQICAKIWCVRKSLSNLNVLGRRNMLGHRNPISGVIFLYLHFKWTACRFRTWNRNSTCHWEMGNFADRTTCLKFFHCNIWAVGFIYYVRICFALLLSRKDPDLESAYVQSHIPLTALANLCTFMVIFKLSTVELILPRNLTSLQYLLRRQLK